MTLTEEQKLALEQGIPLRNGVPVETLSSASLSPTPDISSQITTPQVTNPYPVAGLNAELPELEATPQEVQGDAISQRLQQLNDQLIGQSAFRTQKEGEAGIPTLIKTQQDLAGKLKILQAEAQSIPIRAEEEALGRGITRSGQIPITQAQLRRNAIQALETSAFLEATRGNLETSLLLIDRAVEQKYGVIKEEIQAKMANLELILKSPEFSRTQKNRAEQQKLILEARQQETERQQDVDNTKRKIAVEVAAGGKATSAQLNQIVNAPNEIEAARLASPFLQQEIQRDTQLTEAGGKKLLIDTQTGEIIKDYGSSTVPPIPVTNPDGQMAVFGTPEYLIGRLQQTAGSKTKPVASEREQLGKFANVVALTESLMTSLDKTTTDPIVGYLKSQNPYDFDARAVNAQVTALVPSVARALYGEVGVLTDSDIERYLKTLPNIRSTEDQNKFIALMTLGNAKRSYEQTLLNLANSNVNVSGFADSYKSIVDKVNKLESDLKIDEPQISGEDDAIFDEVVGTKSTGNYFKNLWNSILGR